MWDPGKQCAVNRADQGRSTDSTQLFTDPCTLDVELLVDSGSTVTLVPQQWEDSFINATKSQLTAECANGSDIAGLQQGTLQLWVENRKGTNTMRGEAHSASVVPIPLLTLDDKVCNENMKCYLAKTGSRMFNDKYDIPLLYDENRGGWWLRAKLIPTGCKMTREHEKLFAVRQQRYAEHLNRSPGRWNSTAIRIVNAMSALNEQAGERLRTVRIESKRTISMPLQGHKFPGKDSGSGHMPAGNAAGTPPPLAPKGRRRLDEGDEDDKWNYYYLSTKQALGAKANMTALEFHQDACHVGYHPDCIHCAAGKSNKRRIATQVDPYVPTLPGQMWYMDTVTFPVRSIQGSKYAIIMRNPAVKFFVTIPLVFRSESTPAIEQTIIAIRADPMFKQSGHELFEYIYMDIAGEWSPDTREWTQMCVRLGIHPIWKSPETKSGAIEKSVGIIEAHVNATMFAQNLPQEWWERIMTMTTWHLNRFPTSCSAIDGDVASPIELLQALWRRDKLPRLLVLKM